MEIRENGEIVVKFNPLKKLVFDRENRVIKYWGGEIYFYQVMGYWKNYRPVGGKMLYYAVLLTREKMHRITPEISEEEVEKVLNILRDLVPAEAKE